MRALLTIFLVISLGCSAREKHPRDPRFDTLGELAQDLSNDPKTFDAILDALGTNIAPMGQAQKIALQTMFKNKDWTGLDKQPETTLDTLKSGLDLLAEHRQGTTVKPIEASIRASTAELGIPTGKPGPEGEPFVKELGLGLKFGDRVAPEKRARFTDSERLAQVLDRLAMQDGFTVDGFRTGSDLIAALQKDHQVVIVDERLAANFGDLERNGKPIATPLWVSTGKGLADGTVLALPVPHAQLKLTIRGPRVNADVTLYPALDLTGEGGGGTRFRADLTGDQPWTGGVVAHRYEGTQAIEAVRLMGELKRVVDARVVEKNLPLDGYFALGVCTLAPAIVEQALLGKTTLWPLTHDPALWSGDTEIDKLARALPHDGRGAPVADDERLKASIPWPTLDSVPFEHTRKALKQLGWR